MKEENEIINEIIYYMFIFVIGCFTCVLWYKIFRDCYKKKNIEVEKTNSNPASEFTIDNDLI